MASLRTRAHRFSPALRGTAVLSLVFSLTQCGGGSPEAKTAAVAAKKERSAAGSTLHNPVVRCGPEESYRYVANEFRCPDGENPFEGDVEAARKAQRGSNENPRNGHVVDIYRVPCGSGPVHLFVDLYGCETYEKRLLAKSGRSAELAQLVQRYESQDFRGVAQHCADPDTGMPPDEASECMTLLPASLVMLGRAEAGIGFLGELCNNMPEASSLSDIRTHMVIRTVAFVDHARDLTGEPLDSDEGSRLLGAFATVCDVSAGDIERYVQKHETL